MTACCARTPSYKVADKVTESHIQPLSVASVTSGPTTIQKNDKFGLLLGEVRSLSRELQSLKLKVEHNDSHGRSRSSAWRPTLVQTPVRDLALAM